ncbi:MAG: hypothetical protein HOV81_32185 [Kofleriaceae bacterium]|nr:hypothetical protein [Kofleriaceae bacterium]
MKTRLISALLLALAACSDPPNVGGTCTGNGDCDDGLTCNTAAAGGYCTQACTMPGQTEGCPEESICDEVIDNAMECVKICKTSADCRSDQDCNGVTSSSIKACKPK